MIGAGPSPNVGYSEPLFFNDENYKLNIPMRAVPDSQYAAAVARNEVTNIPSYEEAVDIQNGNSSKVIAVQDFGGPQEGSTDTSSHEYGISTSGATVAVRVDIPVENVGKEDAYIPISADYRWRCEGENGGVGSSAEGCQNIALARHNAAKDFKLPTSIKTGDFDEHGLITASPACVPTRNMGSWSKVTTDVYKANNAFSYERYYNLHANPGVTYLGLTGLEDGCDIAAAIVSPKGTKEFPKISYPKYVKDSAPNVKDNGGNVNITPLDPPAGAGSSGPRMASFLVSLQGLISSNHLQTARGFDISLPGWVENPRFTLVGTQSKAEDGTLTPKEVQGYSLSIIKQEDYNTLVEQDYEKQSEMLVPSYEGVQADQAAGINSRTAIIDLGVVEQPGYGQGTHAYTLGVDVPAISSLSQPSVVAIRVDVPIPDGVEAPYVPMRAALSWKCEGEDGGPGSAAEGCQSLEEYRRGFWTLPDSSLIKPGDFDEHGLYWGSTCAVTLSSSSWNEISDDVSVPYFTYAAAFNLANSPGVTYGSASYAEDGCDQAVALSAPVQPSPEPTPSLEPTPTPSASVPASTPAHSPSEGVEKKSVAKDKKKLAYTGVHAGPLLIAAGVAILGGALLSYIRARRA